MKVFSKKITEISKVQILFRFPSHLCNKKNINPVKLNVMKKVLLVLVCLFGFSLYAMSSNDKPIQVTDMPKQAQLFINKYFNGKSVAMAKMETDFLSKSYDVIFTNGDKLEFDKKGVWTNVDCKQTQVPKDILPKEILNYLNANYPNLNVRQIEKTDSKGYDVELSNGVELEFNKKLQVIDIDN